MNIILLSGGSGKRLWPLSNAVRSKQFIRIFKKEDGTYESMVQRVFRQIRQANPDSKVTIATSKTQISTIRNQLGGSVGISMEPCRRDTFPAIALTLAYLHDIKNVSEEEVVIVCPVDPYVEDDYFRMFSVLEKQVEKEEANIVLMGICPTYPSEDYGYIIPRAGEDDEMCMREPEGSLVGKAVEAWQKEAGKNEADHREKNRDISEISDAEYHVCRVDTFTEKPDQESAKAYIKRGALWNAGVFAFRLGYILEKSRALLHFSDYQELYDRYSTIKGTSFDYAMVEKEADIQVMPYSGIWKDLGTWDTLTEEMSEHVLGKARLSDTCEQVSVVNELDIPILCMGLKDLVISASAEGILVSDKKESVKIKPYVEELKQNIRFAEKSWGRYEVQDVEAGNMTVKITLNPGQRLNYHSHERRDEVWVVLSGTGSTIVDDLKENVRVGDVITMQAGCKHTIIAETELKLLEVQLGKEISAHDKQKYPFKG